MSAEDLELLKFYHEIGIDSMLIETDGENILKDKNVTQSSSAQGISTSRKSNRSDLNFASYDNANLNNIKDKKEKRTIFPSEWIIKARELANNSNSIEDLKNAVQSFEGCKIKKTATNTVFSDGNLNAKIMLIGEAPGVNEDLKGRPFCGASGILLDKMLEAINLDRSKVYISNTVFWRPPGNRRPTDLELDICRPFVEKQIALVSPKILVLAGGIACYSLLDSTRTISKLRGRFHKYTNQYLSDRITTAVIFHPAYLIRQPAQKRLAWEDLKKIRDYLQ